MYLQIEDNWSLGTGGGFLSFGWWRSGLLINLSEEVHWEIIPQGGIGVAQGQHWLGGDAFL